LIGVFGKLVKERGGNNRFIFRAGIDLSTDGKR